ncbi:hypothetical protein [Formosa sp. 4Alg 33]|uniref:hypothetical protein n=1 Tax=Formosa sp. 4Alg 33 TaxID=3382189 RepID=UPI003D9C23B7
MEYFLSIVIILLLLLQGSKINTNSSRLQKDIDALTDKISHLTTLIKTEQASESSEKETDDTVSLHPINATLDLYI